MVGARRRSHPEDRKGDQVPTTKERRTRVTKWTRHDTMLRYCHRSTSATTAHRLKSHGTASSLAVSIATQENSVRITPAPVLGQPAAAAAAATGGHGAVQCGAVRCGARGKKGEYSEPQPYTFHGRSNSAIIEPSTRVQTCLRSHDFGLLVAAVLLAL